MDGGPRKPERQEPSSRIGILNFERRRYPRFTVDLPIEYQRVDTSLEQAARATNISEGGLLIYFPERFEIGQRLRIKLFFTGEAGLTRIECLGEVVWIEMHMGEGWGDYRSGIKFIDILPRDLEALRGFIRSLWQK